MASPLDLYNSIKKQLWYFRRCGSCEPAAVGVSARRPASRLNQDSPGAQERQQPRTLFSAVFSLFRWANGSLMFKITVRYGTYLKDFAQRCGSRSRIRIFSIPDPISRIQSQKDSGSRLRICIKEFKCFLPKKLFPSSRKYDPRCSSQIGIPDPDLDFLPIPDTK